MDQYAVFGNPIAQSKSPFIHKSFAKETDQILDYRAILAPTDSFHESLEAFFADSNAKGCNVTMPFKEQAAQWVDELSPAAKIAGAVNTIMRKGDGTFWGDTTDGYGLTMDLVQYGIQLEGKRILLIGAGGAARGVIIPIMERNPSALVIANRTEQKALTLASLVKENWVSGCTFEELDQLDAFDLIINSTSASLSNVLPSVSEEVISRAEAVYDMVYLPEPTIFMQHANDLGVKKTIDGLGMLVGQAAKSFSIWRGVEPNCKPVLEQLRKAL